MEIVQQQLGIHQARVQLFRQDRKRIPVFVVAELHAAVYNLFKTIGNPYNDHLYEWFRARVTEYLNNMPLPEGCRERYLAVPLQWEAFQQHMRVYHIAFRRRCFASLDVRGLSERMFMHKVGLSADDGLMATALYQRNVEQATLTSALLQIMFRMDHIPGDVWSHVASFLHPLYVHKRKQYDHRPSSRTMVSEAAGVGPGGRAVEGDKRSRVRLRA